MFRGLLATAGLARYGLANTIMLEILFLEDSQALQQLLHPPEGVLGLWQRPVAGPVHLPGSLPVARAADRPLQVHLHRHQQVGRLGARVLTR